jgi:hypothetical protein
MRRWRTLAFAWAVGLAACGRAEVRAPAPPLSNTPPHRRLGPIDIDAPTLDPAALFPGTVFVHTPAITPNDGTATIPEQLAATDGHDEWILIELGRGRATYISIRPHAETATIETSEHIALGEPVDAFVRAAPHATCRLHWGRIECTTPPGFVYDFWMPDSDREYPVPLDQLPRDEQVRGIAYRWDDGGPIVTLPR